jgi:hypothetical protein
VHFEKSKMSLHRRCFDEVAEAPENIKMEKSQNDTPLGSERRGAKHDKRKLFFLFTVAHEPRGVVCFQQIGLRNTLTIH